MNATTPPGGARTGQKGLLKLQVSHMGHSVQSIAVQRSLTKEDIRAVTDGVRSSTAFWAARASWQAGPYSRAGNVRWAYLYWIGPPAEGIVPSIAVTRDCSGYRVTIVDPLEYFGQGHFEVHLRPTAQSAARLACEIAAELKDCVLRRPEASMSELLSLLIQVRSGAHAGGEGVADQSLTEAMLHDAILALATEEAIAS